MAKSLVNLIKMSVPGAVVESHDLHGDETVVLVPSEWKSVCRFLKESPQADMQMLTDLTAVDFPDRDERFEVVAHLYSLNKGHRIRLKSRVGNEDAEGAEIDSLTELWGSANWLERECWDMLGIKFLGHPDLRRILMYPEFVGHPLRKDYPAEKIQPLVEYLNAPNTDKLAPFGEDEGMSFGRQTHSRAGRNRCADEDLN